MDDNSTIDDISTISSSVPVNLEEEDLVLSPGIPVNLDDIKPDLPEEDLGVRQLNPSLLYPPSHGMLNASSLEMLDSPDGEQDVQLGSSLGGTFPMAMITGSVEGLDTVALETADDQDDEKSPTVLSDYNEVEEAIGNLLLEEESDAREQDLSDVNIDGTVAISLNDGDDLPRDKLTQFFMSDSYLEGDSTNPAASSDNQTVADAITAAKQMREDVCHIENQRRSQSEEPTRVSFEGDKLEDGSLHRVNTTAIVNKYFTNDSQRGGDAAAKSFFDVFTAGDTDATPATASHGSPSIPTTPPVSVTASSLSPSHALPPLTIGHPTGIPSLSSPINSPLHKPFSESKPDILFKGEDDPFSALLEMSVSDRRHDAWIPSDATQQVLVARVTQAQGPTVMAADILTHPHIVISELQGDPIKQLVQKFMGDQEANKRKVIDLDDISHDEKGLQQLIKSENWRMAVDLTGQMLEKLGQGSGATQPVNNTPESIQIWFCRIALLMKLRQYSQADVEMQAFGSLDNPDLYFEYYPELYTGRRGSIVPFSMRLLQGELPQFLGKSQESLDRLYYMHAIVKKILNNLASGLAEDGSMVELSTESRRASIELWESREVRVLFAIVNCLLHVKDFTGALTVMETIKKTGRVDKAALLGSVGRIYLQMGDTMQAQVYFEESEAAPNTNDNMAKCTSNINRGFVAMGQNEFSEARQFFQEAVQLDPGNAVATNNMAVCSLYMGKLKEALTTLEDMVHQDPARYLQEGILFNLCTLYELESSRALQKKQALLELVSKHKGNGFNIACLKMSA